MNAADDEHEHVLHVDFFPLRIRVYRNGDVYDEGRAMTVTRKEFKHWLVFLDALTMRLRTPTAVRRLFTTRGIPIQHFDELEHNGEYVAVEVGPFVHCDYGRARWERGQVRVVEDHIEKRVNVVKRFNPIIRVVDEPPSFLNSAESVDIYLKKEGFGSITGLPYPFDGILSRSPSASALHLKHFEPHQNVPRLKMGGSMEQLNNSWEMNVEKTQEEPTTQPTSAKNGVGKEDNIRMQRDDNERGEKNSGRRSERSKSEKSRQSTRLPRLVNAGRGPPGVGHTKSASPKRTLDVPLPPINGASKSTERVIEIRVQKDDNDDDDGGELQKVNDNDRRNDDALSPSFVDEDVRIIKSYQITEMTYTTQIEQRPSGSQHNTSGPQRSQQQQQQLKSQPQEKQQQQQLQVQSQPQEQKPQRQRPQHQNQKQQPSGSKAVSIKLQEDAPPKGRRSDQDDVDTSNPPTKPPPQAIRREEEIDDLLHRARLWERNKRETNSRHYYRQTVSETRRQIEFFDPDVD